MNLKVVYAVSERAGEFEYFRILNMCNLQAMIHHEGVRVIRGLNLKMGGGGGGGAEGY